MSGESAEDFANEVHLTFAYVEDAYAKPEEEIAH